MAPMDNYSNVENNLYILVNSFYDYGEYCCTLSNKIGKNSSCVYVNFLPTGYTSAENFQITVFSILALSVLSMIIITVIGAFKKHTKVRFVNKKISIIIFYIQCNFFQKKKMRQLRNEHDIFVPTEEIPLVEKETKLEISLSNIQFYSQLGGWCFTNVFKARINGIDADIAVKTTNGMSFVIMTYCSYSIKISGNNNSNLNNDLKFMLYIGRHENIVSLIGFCPNSLPDKFYVFVEYCEFGSLDDFLYTRRESFVDQCSPNAEIIKHNVELNENVVNLVIYFMSRNALAFF